MGSIDAVLFDFGHTLFDSVPASQHCRRYEDARGVTVDDEAFTVLWGRSKRGHALLTSRTERPALGTVLALAGP